MKIGVISDTHLRSGDDTSILTKLVEELYFKDVDLILHAGDHVELAVVEMALAPKKMIAVSGNMDYGEAAELPTKRILELGGKKIGLSRCNQGAYSSGSIRGRPPGARLCCSPGVEC